MEQILDKVTKTLKLNSDPEYYIVFSDLHGNSQSIDLIKRAQFDYPSAQLVGLGDYIDGRRNSKMVLDFLIRMKSKGAIILRGNHEQMLLDYARGFDLEHLCFFNGGKTTLFGYFLARLCTRKQRILSTLIRRLSAVFFLIEKYSVK